MILCQYGCGQTAIHFRSPSRKLPKGKWTCAKSHLSCPAVKERRYQTNLEKYGATNVFAVIHEREEFSEVSQGMRQAASDRMIDKDRGLGFSNPDILEKANEAFRKKHGVDNPMFDQSIVSKRTDTNMERYGVPCPAALEIQYQRSRIADKWLDGLAIPENQREQWIQLGERRIKVDALDPDTNTVYEFWGDYWHGNPRCYPSSMVNQQAHRTMSELYEATVSREALLREQGFNVVTIWEQDFRGSR